MAIGTPQVAFICAWENESVQNQRAKTKLWLWVAVWLLLLSAQVKKDAVAVIFLIQFFSSCVFLSDVLAIADVESVCTHKFVAFVSGEFMIWCWVIFTATYLLTVPLPGLLWRNVHQARYNQWYTKLKSDFSKYYCTLCSNLNCGWFMQPFFLVNKRYISYNDICQ